MNMNTYYDISCNNMTLPSSQKITHVFHVGDLVRRILRENDPPTTDIYRIETLREENGGSFHDGYTITTIATLCNIATKEEEHDVVIRYDNYMCRYVYEWAIPVVP